MLQRGTEIRKHILCEGANGTPHLRQIIGPGELQFKRLISYPLNEILGIRWTAIERSS